MLRFRRATVALVILMTLSPTLVFGQAPTKAGIVTTLEGRATATRVVLPQPVALTFKDDVFLNDEITTAEKSLARILLGGKAVVTVRERSSLTITEVPGLSTIDIASGKIALAVARERMRPGERIQIRTPNAITGIRGTSLIVDVIRSIADIRQPDPNALTRLGVFHGDVDVQHIHPITKAPLAPSVNVAVNTKFTATGARPAAVGPFQPGDAESFQAGLTPSAPQHVQAANEPQLVFQAQETADTLLRTLIDGTAALVAPPVTVTLASVDPRPQLNDQRNIEVVVVPPAPGIVIDPALQPFFNAASVVLVPSGAGSIATAGNAFEVGTSAPTAFTLSIPLLTVENGDLTVAGHLLNVVGPLSSTGTSPVVGLGPTTVTTSGDLVRVAPGGTLTVAGTLVNDVGGTLNVGGSVIGVDAGGAFRSTTASPAIELSNTTANITQDFLRIGGGAAPAATANVSGPLVQVTNGILRIGSPSIAGNVIGNGGFENGFTEWTVFNQPGSDGNFFIQSGTTSPTSGFAVPAPPIGNFAAMSDQSAPGAHILYRDVTVPAASPVLRFALFIGNRHTAFASPNSLDFTTIPNQQVRVDLVNPTANIQDVGGGVLRNLFQTQPGDPLVSGYQVFTVDLSDFAGQTIRLRFSEVDNQLFLQLGVDDVMLGSQVVLPPSLLRLDGGRVTSTSADALLMAVQSLITTSGDVVSLTRGSTLTTPGTLLSATGGTLVPASGTVLSLSGGSSLTAGRLLDLTDIALALTGPVVSMAGGSSLTTTMGSAINITGGSLTADSLIATDNGSNVINLTGTVLDLTNTTVTLNRVERAGEAFVNAQRGANVPLLRMSGSTLTLNEELALFDVGVDQGTPITQSGVAMITTGTAQAPSRINLNFLMDLGGVTVTDPNPQIQLTGTVLRQTGDGPLIEVRGLPVTTAGPLLRANNSTFDLASTLLDVDSGTFRANGAAAGALLQFTGSSLTTRSDLVFVGPDTTFRLDRGLIDAVNSTFVISDNGGVRRGTLLAVVDGASITTEGTNAPLLRFALTDDANSSVTAKDSFLLLEAPRPGTAAPSMALSGPLLGATLTDFVNGDPATNARSFIFVADGARLTSTSDDSLISLNRSTVNTSGGFFTVRRSGSTPSRVDLDGPLLQATGGSITGFSTALLNSQGQPRTCCSVFVVSQGGRFTSNTAAPLITLDGTSVQAGDFFTVVSDFADLLNEPMRATAFLTLSGPLLNADNGANFRTGRDFLGVFSSSLRSTTTQPLLDIDGVTITVGGAPSNPTTTHRLVHVNLATGSTTRASVNLDGPLFRSTGSTITTTDDGFGVFNGSQFTSTTQEPLISIEGGSFRAGAVGNFFVLASSPGGLPASLSLNGPLLSASGTMLFNGDPTSTAQTFLFVGNGSTLTSTTPAALLAFDNTTVDTTGNVVGITRSPSAAAPSTVTLDGPLLFADRSNFNTTTRGFGTACCSGFFVGQGGRLTSDTTRALIEIRNSVFSAGPDAQSGGSFFFVTDTSGGVPNETFTSPSAVTLAGPLLLSTNSTITALFSLLGVTRSSISSTSGQPLIQLDNSGTSVAVGGVNALDGARTFGSLLTASAAVGPADEVSPASITLAGALLRSTSTGTNTITATANAFGLFSGATLSSTTLDSLIQLTNTTFSADIAGRQTTFFLLTDRGGVGGATPSSAILRGSLLNSRNSSITVTADILRVLNLATLSSTTTNPLVELTNSALITTGNGLGPTPEFSSQVFGNLVYVCCNAPGGGSVSLGGPLLSAVNSPLTLPRSFVWIDGAGSFTSGSGDALLRISGGTHAIATNPDAAMLRMNGGIFSAPNADFLDVRGGATINGGPFARLATLASVTLHDSLVSATDSSITVAGDLLNVSDGATLGTNMGEVPGPQALVSLVTSNLNVGTSTAPGTMFNLFGRGGGPFQADPQVNPVTGTSTGLVFGNDRPLLRGGGGPLLETFQEANVNVQGSVARIVDAQLLAATVPALVNLTGGSTLSTSSHAADLVRNAKVELRDLIQLSGSTMTVGSAANIANLVNINASRLNLSGDLVKLAGVSTLNVFGTLLNVLNGGVADINGSLVRFTGTNNLINVTNTLAPTTFIRGIPIHVAQGANFQSSINGTPLAGLNTTTNLIRINNTVLHPNATGGATGSLISVQGTGGTVRIGPPPSGG